MFLNIVRCVVRLKIFHTCYFTANVYMDYGILLEAEIINQDKAYQIWLAECNSQRLCM